MLVDVSLASSQNFLTFLAFLLWKSHHHHQKNFIVRIYFQFFRISFFQKSHQHHQKYFHHYFIKIQILEKFIKYLFSSFKCEITHRKSSSPRCSRLWSWILLFKFIKIFEITPSICKRIIIILALSWIICFLLSRIFKIILLLIKKITIPLGP